MAGCLLRLLLKKSIHRANLGTCWIDFSSNLKQQQRQSALNSADFFLRQRYYIVAITLINISYFLINRANLLTFKEIFLSSRNSLRLMFLKHLFNRA